MYSDLAFTNAAKEGVVPPELQSRYIRGTIECMKAVSCAKPYERYPTTAELNEMSKSIVIHFPCLNKVYTRLQLRIFVKMNICD